jgi:hypothetical protein
MGYLGIKAETHWRTNRPKMCQALKAAGLMDKAVAWVNRRAVDEMVWLMRRGPPWWSAEEVALAKFLFPSEEEQDTLTQDQMPFLPSE